jgi:UDP-N-acetylglucosamine--N-acetylmuramyl-(pentapeptide) pyrophosphoryl-undecaprenol N-acetylglucosamine transferase
VTVYLLAGGGTAGHVNPLLAVGDRLRLEEPDATVLVLGTAEGLEARLVPERGYELLTIPRMPFPRRLNAAAAGFPGRFGRAIGDIVRTLREREVDVVVGFGGYAAAPAYLAARRARIPFALHEANAMPGLANRLGARFTPAVGIAFPGTPLPHARLVGMPLRREIAELDRAERRDEALEAFGLDTERPVLLVTGGSLGARRINEAVSARAQALVDAGVQVLHAWGSGTELVDPGIEHYHVLPYLDRMDLALAAADVALCRAGSGTVSELTALGLPAIYVPYAVGNGEQRKNAASVVEKGGALLVDDADLTPEWIDAHLLRLIVDPDRLAVMSARARELGVVDGAERMTALVRTLLPTA